MQACDPLSPLSLASIVIPREIQDMIMELVAVTIRDLHTIRLTCVHNRDRFPLTKADDCKNESYLMKILASSKIYPQFTHTKVGVDPTIVEYCLPCDDGKSIMLMKILYRVETNGRGKPATVVIFCACHRARFTYRYISSPHSPSALRTIPLSSFESRHEDDPTHVQIYREIMAFVRDNLGLIQQNAIDRIGRQ